jgi:hypothetical protein
MIVLGKKKQEEINKEGRRIEEGKEEKEKKTNVVVWAKYENWEERKGNKIIIYIYQQSLKG